MQFEIANPLPAKLTIVQNRSEKHGESDVPAITIYFEVETSNDFLDMISPGLKAMIYGPPQGTEPEPGLPGVEPVSTLPRLRCAILGPITIDKEWAGYTFAVDHNVGDTHKVVIAECQVAKVKCDCKEGGTVTTTIRVQASGLDAETIGALAVLMNHNAPVTLTAPPLAADLVRDPPPKKKPGRKSKEPDATEIFAASKAAEGLET